MGRVWALTGALVLVGLIIYIFNGFLGGADVIKIASLCYTVGAAAAYFPAPGALARGMYLLGGTLVGLLGFLLGAGVYPDNNLGLFLGAAVPGVIGALVAMWSKSEYAYLTVLLGAAAYGGSYVTSFDLDPQGVSHDAPIVLGWVLVPVALGYLAATLIKGFLPPADADDEAETDSDEGDSSDDTAETREVNV
jgi:hypothetical protein